MLTFFQNKIKKQYNVKKKIQIAKNLGLGCSRFAGVFILCKRFIGFKALNVSLVILSVKKNVFMQNYKHSNIAF